MNSLKSKKTHNPESESDTKEKEKNHLLKYQALLIEIKRRDTRRFMSSAFCRFTYAEDWDLEVIFGFVRAR